MLLLPNKLKWIKSQFLQLKNGDKKTFVHKIKKLLNTSSFFLLIFVYLPIFLIIRLFSNYFLVRFGKLPSKRIGHFANDLNLYISEKKRKSKRGFDIFYAEKPICNIFLYNVFKKSITILPEFLILPLIYLNRIKLIGDAKHNAKLHKFNESLDLRDREKDNEIVNYFTKKDIENGYKYLEEMGLKKGDKYVCLLCRDETYVNDLFSKHYDLDYYKSGDQSKFRNCDIEDFRLVSEYLMSLGYHVFRMGQTVEKKFSLNNSKFIDYANSKHKSDFLDIFLSSHCNFFLSTGAGIDIVAAIFNKPIVFVSFTLVSQTRSVNKKQLIIFKHFKNKNSRKKLTLSEIFDLNLADVKRDEIFNMKGIQLEDNSPEEIKEAVADMLKLIENNFVLDKEELILQKKFWNLFKDKIDKYNFKHYHADFFKSHIGYSFLRKNNNFLN